MRTTTAFLISCAAVTITMAAYPASLPAQELYLLGGRAESTGSSDSSYSWQLDYTQDIRKHFAASLAYLNEGHLGNHRRDGYTAQGWLRTDLFRDHLSFAAGVGPYFFLDTRDTGNWVNFANEHGWKVMTSLAATYRTSKNLLLVLRSNYVTGGRNVDSLSALAGIGYEFRPAPSAAGGDESSGPAALKNEIAVLLGQTIVNSLDSQHSLATEVEYRRTVLRHMDWTLALLNEGDSRLVRRDGVVTQVWGTQQMLEDSLTIGAGAGGYFDVGHYHSPGNGRFASVIATLTSSYRITPHWAARVSWNRVVTNYDRDTDVILGGVGYRF